MRVNLQGDYNASGLTKVIIVSSNIKEQVKHDNEAYILEIITSNRHYSQDLDLNIMQFISQWSDMLDFTSDIALKQLYVSMVFMALKAETFDFHGNTMSQNISKRMMEYVTKFVGYYSPVKMYTKNRAFFINGQIYCERILLIVQDLLEAALHSYNAGQAIHLDISLSTLYKLIRIFSRGDKISGLLNAEPLRLIQVIHNSLVAYKNDILSDIICDCASVLANAISHPSNRKLIIENGSLGIIISKIPLFINEGHVITEILAALSNFALFEKTANVLVSSNVFSQIKEIYNCHSSCNELLVILCQFISNVCKKAKNTINNPEIFAEIVYAILTKHQDIKIEIAAMNALGSLAFSNYNVYLIQDKLPAVFVDLIRNYNDSPSFLSAALFALSHLAFGQMIPIDKFVSLGGINDIVSILKRFWDYQNIQIGVFFALGSLTLGNDNCKEEVYKLGALPYILKGITSECLLNTNGGSVNRVITAFQVSAPENVDIAPDHRIVYATDLLDTPSSYTDEVFPNLSRTHSANSSASNLLRDEISIDNPSQVNSSNRNSKNVKMLGKDTLKIMFACICLLNLTEHQKCKDELQRLGAVHYIYYAFLKTKHSSDLKIVIFSLLHRIVDMHSTQIVITLKQKKILHSLEDMCKRDIVNNLIPAPSLNGSFSGLLEHFYKLPILSFLGNKNSENRKEFTGSLEQNIKLRLKDLNLPKTLSTETAEFVICKNCLSKPCFPLTCFRQYRFYWDIQEFYVYCSENCAKDAIDKKDETIHESQKFDEVEIDVDELRGWKEFIEENK